MGSNQSSHVNTNTSTPKDVNCENTRGLKIMKENVALSIDDSDVSIEMNAGSLLSFEEAVLVDAVGSAVSFGETDDEESSDDDFSSDEEADEELDEFFAERLCVLADARNLKHLAIAFLHPEAPVEADSETFGRNYFTRPSAPEQESVEEAEEHAQILADVMALKKLAVDYLHPELSVVTSDGTIFGRNYFTRASAPEQETVEETEERAQILADSAALKKLAVDYLHPELPVVASDAAACGRNYFSRASAPEQESVEDSEERAQILAEAASLKKLAADHLHPELSVIISDSAACGRNYFTRPSAPEQESVEEAEEHAQILADAMALKKLAVDYLHPELSVVTSDGTIFGRNYFTRASAPEQETVEETEERAQILADSAALKKLAVDYLHPELPVVASDAAACGRNYFSRASAPEQESVEDSEERAQILAEAASLKKLAADHLHPELSVIISDSAACGRNYFTRPSAPEQESVEEAEEHAQILADAIALKKLAVDYLHPELSVVTSDGTIFGRNYFTRASAPEQETVEETEERAQILADSAALKKLAVDYLHPELPVVASDAAACGRNYFSRASAPEQESVEDSEERAQILAEAASLKKLAADHLHPELSVIISDSAACGRNYFTRPSAPEQESVEEAEEHAQILADAIALKKLAVDYLHPELSVVTSDGTIFGRNYFTRASAPEQETVEETEERAQILADSAALKKLAVDYLHPELPVVASDAAACGRNYFSRASAPEQESVEDSEERAQILAEAASLKKLAADHLHPELSVIISDSAACGRNYFTRPSAPEQESVEEAEEHAQILADAIALKKLAVDYLHPELSVVTSDGTIFGRNYFTRASAPEQESTEEVEQRDQVLADASSFKKFAVDFLHPELPVGASTRAADKNSKLAIVHDSSELSCVKSPSAVMLFGFENQSF